MVNSLSGEVVITVLTVGFNDARTRVASGGNCQESRVDRGRRLLSFHRFNS